MSNGYQYVEHNSPYDIDIYTDLSDISAVNPMYLIVIGNCIECCYDVPSAVLYY